ncbi:MAG: FAD-binding protein [Verrucomicrobiales bacterium]|nr:FAD-binding protein [Verrucomicrobiales bacterium]
MPCPSPSCTGGQQADQRWQNYIRSVDLRVKQYWTPKSLQELVYIVQRAESGGHRVHAVGAGYSFEDIAATPDWMVDLRNLGELRGELLGPKGDSRALTSEWRARQADGGPDKLVHVEAGIRLFDLCQELDALGLALPTMGGALGQHLAGAFSTSTHGSDVDLPPLCDLVQAVHLVTTGGQELWIEAASRPVTSNDAVLRTTLNACPDLQIIRDDDMLDSVVVGMGRFGIIYSVILQVTRSLRLAEFSQEMGWREVAEALSSGVGPSSGGGPFGRLNHLLREPPRELEIAGAASDYRYLDLVFNSRNSSTCWVRRRWPTTSGSDLNVGDSSNVLCHKGMASTLMVAASGGLVAYSGLVAATGLPQALVLAPIILARSSNLATRAATSAHMTTGEALAVVLNTVWETLTETESAGLRVDGGALSEVVEAIVHTSVADTLKDSVTSGRRGLNWVVSAGRGDPEAIGSCYRGNSIEIIFSLETRAYIDFLDRVLAESRGHRQAGYIAVRFTSRSRSLLSMHNVNHEVACSVEITSLRGLADNGRWMRWVERTALGMGGRPHWGQQNNLTAAEIHGLYPAHRIRRWRRALERVARLSPTFSNAYTMRRGLEPRPVGPGGAFPLEQYWNASRGDNFLLASDAAANDAAAANYQFVRFEGFTVPREMTGAVALELFWHPGRGDNFLTATDAGKRDAIAAGYRRVRVEGFVLRDRAPGTVPLDQFWHERRGDNFLTATEAGRMDARFAGYRFVRTEGYIFPLAVAFRAHAGTYVCAENGGGGNLVADRSAIREWERFEMVYLQREPTRIGLRAANGQFVCAETGGGTELKANRHELRSWEKFELVRATGGKVALRVANGQYVCAEGGAGKLVANRSAVREWESFELVGV